MEKINYNSDYLYCSITSNPSDGLCDNYDSPEECFEDYKDEILEDCKKREYDEFETAAVLNHYSIKFSNWGGEWKNKY